jgi:hypothetical protein
MSSDPISLPRASSHRVAPALKPVAFPRQLLRGRDGAPFTGVAVERQEHGARVYALLITNGFTARVYHWQDASELSLEGWSALAEVPDWVANGLRHWIAAKGFTATAIEAPWAR